MISWRRTIDGQAGGNLDIVAGDTPLDRESVEAAILAWGEAAPTAVLADPIEVEGFVGGSSVLMDDFAPVDQLLGR